MRWCNWRKRDIIRYNIIQYNINRAHYVESSIHFQYFSPCCSNGTSAFGTCEMKHRTPCGYGSSLHLVSDFQLAIDLFHNFQVWSHFIFSGCFDSQQWTFSVINSSIYPFSGSLARSRYWFPAVLIEDHGVPISGFSARGEKPDRRPFPHWRGAFHDLCPSAIPL